MGGVYSMCIKGLNHIGEVTVNFLPYFFFDAVNSKSQISV